MVSIQTQMIVLFFFLVRMATAAPATACIELFSEIDILGMSRTHVLDQRQWNTRYYGAQDSPGVHPGAYVDLKFDYWLVNKNNSRVKTFGDVSSIVDQSGNVFLIGDMHFEPARQPWMHQKSSRILESVFGVKTGELNGHRHSSVRSATLELPAENQPVPVWVKLDGSYLVHVDKKLTMHDINLSRESDDLLKDSQLFLREPGALLVENDSGEIVPMILRQNPLSTVKPLKEGDRLVTLHSLAANLRDYQPQAKYAGRPKNEAPDRFWFKKSDHKRTVNAVLAAIADVVITSIFDFGVHLAPHGQNMEFLISKKGRVRRYWQKDLQEAKVDESLARHLGLKSKDAKYLKKFSGIQADAEVKKWYEDYIRADQQDITENFAEFNQIVKLKLVERFKVWIQSNRSKYKIKDIDYELNQILMIDLAPWQVVLKLRSLVLENVSPN